MKLLFREPQRFEGEHGNLFRVNQNVSTAINGMFFENAHVITTSHACQTPGGGIIVEG